MRQIEKTHGKTITAGRHHRKKRLQQNEMIATDRKPTERNDCSR
jgi:hypothetical protein